MAPVADHHVWATGSQRAAVESVTAAETITSARTNARRMGGLDSTRRAMKAAATYAIAPSTASNDCRGYCDSAPATPKIATATMSQPSNVSPSRGSLSA